MCYSHVEFCKTPEEERRERKEKMKEKAAENKSNENDENDEPKQASEKDFRTKWKRKDTPKKKEIPKTKENTKKEKPPKQSKEDSIFSVELIVLFGILELKPTLNLKLIRCAFLKKSFIFHPDKIKPSEAKPEDTDNYRKIKDAYEILIEEVQNLN
jgi:hypothetical protein